jgi:ParB family chromosome partitioning protein
LKFRRGENRIGGVELVTLPLRRIKWKDGRFRTSYFFDLEPLIFSIKKVGLVSPPLVLNEVRGFVLVSGWKRALACRRLGRVEISALLTEERDGLALFLTALHENLASREFRLAEKAEVIAKLRLFGLADNILIKDYLRLLELPATADHLGVLLDLARAGLTVRRFVEEKDVHLPVVQSLLRFRPAERNLIVPLLGPLGQNKQKEVLDDLWEIQRRDDVPVRAILDRKDIRQARRSEKLAPLARSERIRLLLRRMRFPHLSSCRASFDLCLRRIGWPGDISVQPSPFFEDEEISVGFRAGSPEEFRKRLARLNQAAGKNGLKGLFRR